MYHESGTFQCPLGARRRWQVALGSTTSRILRTDVSKCEHRLSATDMRLEEPRFVHDSACSIYRNYPTGCGFQPFHLICRMKNGFAIEGITRPVSLYRVAGTASVPLGTALNIRRPAVTPWACPVAMSCRVTGLSRTADCGRIGCCPFMFRLPWSRLAGAEPAQPLGEWSVIIGVGDRGAAARRSALINHILVHSWSISPTEDNHGLFKNKKALYSACSEAAPAHSHVAYW